MYATTLEIDLEFTGEVIHSYGFLFGTHNANNRLPVTGADITSDLGAFDQITVRAMLPAGQSILIDPHDAFTPAEIYFSFAWNRSGSVPGGDDWLHHDGQLPRCDRPDADNGGRQHAYF
jgi:hypothetical protein